MRIYRVYSTMKNPCREYTDIFSDCEEAITTYENFKNNPDCSYSVVTVLENDPDCNSSRFYPVEQLTSFFDEVEDK